MKGKVSTPIEWMVSTPRARCRHSVERERQSVDTVLGQEGGGDILTYRRTDQPTRVLEFHVLYGTKNTAKKRKRSSSKLLPKS